MSDESTLTVVVQEQDVLSLLVQEQEELITLVVTGQGEDGLSAYQIWLSRGNTGTQEDFLNSLVGPQGPAGPQGEQGPQGEKGDSAIVFTVVETDLDYTVSPYEYVFVDTRSGAITITLPADPTESDVVKIADKYSTFDINPVIVYAGTHTINNEGGVWELDVKDAVLALNYTNTMGWKIEYLGPFWSNNAAGVLPVGGDAGQLLAKKSNTDFDYEWTNPSESSNYIFLPAAQALGGHRVVRITALDEVDYASSSNVSHANTAIGITTGAASGGANTSVRMSGVLEEVSWSWAPGEPVFLGVDGVLTQTAPTTGFVCEVGVAYKATGIFVDIKPSIILE
jgi:hypothetical protein